MSLPVGPNLSCLHNERWQITNHTLKEAMGCSPTKHWPVEGVPARMVGNVKVWVLPLVEALVKRRGNWSSRAQCECPKCGKVVNAGKLHQHMKIHKEG